MLFFLVWLVVCFLKEVQLSNSYSAKKANLIQLWGDEYLRQAELKLVCHGPKWLSENQPHFETNNCLCNLLVRCLA